MNEATPQRVNQSVKQREYHMTESNSWTRIGEVAPADLSSATLELHWASQFIAAAGQSFVEPREDDSHRSMTWQAARREFVGESFADAYPFRVGLRPAGLTLQLLDRTEQPLGSLPLAGKTIEDGYEWLMTGLANYMERLPEILRPDFALPSHPVQKGARFSEDQQHEFTTLSALYESAATLLGEVVDGHDTASEVRCWPHHFDIATLVTVEQGEDAESAKTIGIGMAPTGSDAGGWYWYVTPWPYPDPADLPTLDGAGAWHTEGWVGAVLSGEEVVQAEAALREAMVRKFIDASVGAALSLL